MNQRNCYKKVRSPDPEQITRAIRKSGSLFKLKKSDPSIPRKTHMLYFLEPKKLIQKRQIPRSRSNNTRYKKILKSFQAKKVRSLNPKVNTHVILSLTKEIDTKRSDPLIPGHLALHMVIFFLYCFNKLSPTVTNHRNPNIPVK